MSDDQFNRVSPLQLVELAPVIRSMSKQELQKWFTRLLTPPDPMTLLREYAETRLLMILTLVDIACPNTEAVPDKTDLLHHVFDTIAKDKRSREIWCSSGLAGDRLRQIFADVYSKGYWHGFEKYADRILRDQ